MTSTSMTSSSTAPLIHSHLNDYGALLNVLLSYFLTSVKKEVMRLSGISFRITHNDVNKVS